MKGEPIRLSGHCAEKYLHVACRNSPVIDRTIKEFGRVSLADYLKKLAYKSPEALQPRDDLVRAVRRYASPLLGEPVAKRASRELEANPVVMTANHHGVDFFSQSVQGSLLFSLHKTNGNGSFETVPIFSCGSVPLDNLTFPLGLLIYRVNGDDLSTVPKKVPVFSNRFRRILVSVAGPLNEDMVQRAQDRIDKMVRGSEIPSTLGGSLHEMFREDYCSNRVLRLKSYSEQAVVLNNRIFKRLFSNPQTAPELVYLELERIVQMVLQNDLLDEKSLAHCVMFDPTLREALIGELDGSKACWSVEKLIKRRNHDAMEPPTGGAVNGCGTLFFWGINESGRRIPLYTDTHPQKKVVLRGVDDRGTDWILPFTPCDIRTALNENRLVPSLFTSFLVLAFARGVTCVGGYYQGEYLPAMQRGLARALKKTPGYGDVAGLMEKTEPYKYLSGMQAVMVRTDNDALIPAGPGEIISGGGLSDGEIEQILSLTVREAHIASLLETVPDVTSPPPESADWKTALARDCHRLLENRIVIK